MQNIQSILFHIGYPKCGSTTIQTTVLPNLPGLIVAKSKSDTRIVSNLLEEFRKPHADISYIRNVVEKESNTIRKHCPTNLQGCTRYIVSHENLSGLTRSSSGSIEIATNIKKAYPNAKILIVIRNQWDLLVSLYSHRVSVKAIEYRSLGQFIEETFSTPEKIEKWRYLELVEYYIELFGLENVKILPLEMMQRDPEEFLRKVSKFHCELGSLCFSIPTSSVIRPRNLSEKNRNVQFVLRYLNRINMRTTRVLRHNLKLSKLGMYVRQRLAYCSRSIVQPLLVKVFRSKKLTLSSQEKQLKERVFNHYAKSNKKLADLIGINLSQYKYY